MPDYDGVSFSEVSIQPAFKYFIGILDIIIVFTTIVANVNSDVTLSFINVGTVTPGYTL